ncbi:hypothetical protein GR160_07495 [Flavobacterium sp. Sd200]|uniref:hypothetical protein n=1 Tax=Flavobacterium sp. Sd200 TaxID=2692211 RepID=UPI00136F5763|nr:hypothetical protein [Flavobacterium sp. Sd200]MXN91071.1 hypothetical protein [Flavobacterium sp. Sd200]
MDSYTMTFKYDGIFDLPNDPGVRDREVPHMVLEKMRHKEFELVDFNLTENYSHNYARHYLNSHLYRSIVEIKLNLSMRALKSRDAIYECCIKAMEKDRLYLEQAYENENRQEGILQSIIIFDMKKDHAAASA